LDVTVTLEARYTITPDGSVWSQFGMAQKFWERYLEVFDSVRIVARASHVEQVPKGWLPVTGRNILFHPIPDFLGPWQCLKQYPAIRAAILSATPARGAVILRVGSQIANIIERRLFQTEHPYALEVVGDPYEVFAPGVVDHPLRPFLRWYFSSHLRQQCHRAAAVAYVTKHALQKRYPTRAISTSISDVDLTPDAIRGDVFRTHYSNIELDSEGLAEGPHAPKRLGPYQLVTVGSLAQMYKGIDVLIEAVARCVQAGVNLTAVIVGDGMYKRDLMRQAERLGMASRIRFAGHVRAGRPVRDILDASDLFVLPSRTEGLPRAMIEAMARRLPCIGSNVGGIPELLNASELVPVGDAAALAVKIQEVLRDPLRMEKISRKNLAEAMEYRDSVLSERRRQFYQVVRDLTRQWEARQGLH
jgi:glycosyltransferase involved in cell wall biosynthesis